MDYIENILDSAELIEKENYILNLQRNKYLRFRITNISKFRQDNILYKYLVYRSDLYYDIPITIYDYGDSCCISYMEYIKIDTGEEMRKIIDAFFEMEDK